jgi:D-alanyl-D-alanine carboxypeptidase
VESQRAAGVAIGVRQGEDFYAMEAFGYADLIRRVPMERSTACAIGSITKQFTAATVMHLVEIGAFGLDEEVQDYLLFSSEMLTGVQVRHLLNHTSGIASAPDRLMLLDSNGAGELSPPIIRKGLEEATPTSRPGHEWHYSNSGYYLLGLLIEKVTGSSYQNCVQEMVLSPCGLADTTHTPAHPYARGYARLGNHMFEVQGPDIQQTFASGSLWSTVSDLVKWQSALEKGEVVSQTAYDRMTTPERLVGGQLLEYGYGFFVVDFGGHRELSHHGSVAGFASQLANYPDDELTIVVLTNGAGNEAERLEKQIAQELLGVPGEEVKSIPLPAGEATTYTGMYECEPMGRLPVFDHQGTLMMETPGRRVSPLVYQGRSLFVLADDLSCRVCFAIDGSVASGFVVTRYAKTLAVARRLV